MHRGHSSITSSKRWVGGVRTWQFLMIYSTVNHQRVGWVGLKKSKTWWRNTWMAPEANQLIEEAKKIAKLWWTPMFHNFYQGRQQSLSKAKLFRRQKILPILLDCHLMIDNTNHFEDYNWHKYFFANGMVEFSSCSAWCQINKCTRLALAMQCLALSSCQ